MVLYAGFIIQEKDKTKFAIIYDTYHLKMYQVALNILKNPSDAEDVCHNTFVAVSKRLDAIQVIESYKTSVYLVKAVKNHAINFINKRNRTPSVAVNFDHFEIRDMSEIEEDYIKSKEVETVLQAILEMKENYRDALTLRFVSELSMKEIAIAMDIPVGTVKSLVSRGLKYLHKSLLVEANDVL